MKTVFKSANSISKKDKTCTNKLKTENLDHNVIRDLRLKSKSSRSSADENLVDGSPLASSLEFEIV